MVSIIRSHVSFAAKDALLRPGEMLTGEAAAACGLTRGRVRQIAKAHGIARWVGRLQLWAVNHQKLTEVLARTKRRRRRNFIGRT
jgi:hypothetical protein